MHRIYISLLLLLVTLSVSGTAFADLKIRQRVTMSGQSYESTRAIKGSRERTEQKFEGQTAAYMPSIVSITQCDMRRTVKINDAKQLYMVEPFGTPAKAAAPARTTAVDNGPTRAGGTMTITYNVRDTGERKTIFGLQARHLIITHEMEASADSCNGPSKTKMEYDGWYVDLSADFNCPAQYEGQQTYTRPDKPDCIDKVVYKGTAAARLGFLIEGTMKMFGKDGAVAMTSTTETLELSRAPLSASLFDIPGGYALASSQQDLYAVNTAAMMSAAANSSSNSNSNTNRGGTAPAAAAPTAKSVGINITVAPGASADQAEIDQYIRGRIASRGLRAVSGSGDYTLNIQVSKVKESTAGKIGGMFGKVTGVPTGGIAKVDIEMTASLTGASSGQAKVKSKFDGPADNAVRAAIDQALDQVLNGVNE